MDIPLHTEIKNLYTILHILAMPTSDLFLSILKRVTNILWFAMCIGFTVDTNLFVYLSLSQTLLGGLVILSLALCGIFASTLGKSSLLRSRIQFLVLAWIIYLALHALYVHPAEVYKLVYLEEMLILGLVLPYLISTKILKQRVLENGVLLMAIIHLSGLVFQSVGLIKSYNTYFPLTGFSENPNVTAILLAVSLPFVWDRMRSSKRKTPWLLFLGVSVLFITLLKCRTAYIGLSAIVFIRLAFSSFVKEFWRKRDLWTKSAVISVLLIVVLIAGLALYRSKQASTDGRLLIWKVSSMMINEHPMGIGVGMYEHDYNLRQGEYFASGESTESERFNSGFVYMAYNDFIEHTLETGIPGGLFLLVFYLLLIYKAYQPRQIKEFSMVCAFMLMSCTNFIYATIQPWIVLVYSASQIMCSNADMVTVNKRETQNRIILSVCFLACVYLIYFHNELMVSQGKLKHYQDNVCHSISIDQKKVLALGKTIETSEAYYRFLYEWYYKSNELDRALYCIDKALTWTSSTDLYFAKFNLLCKMNRNAEAKQQLLYVKNMLPQNLTSRYALFRIYVQDEMYDQASAEAKDIASMRIKIKNDRSVRIKSEAVDYLKKRNTKQQ